MYRKLHKTYLGIAMGLMEGLAVWLGTFILVVQGEKGEVFLSRFFPYYTVSVSGAFIGLAEGFIDGFIGGFFLAAVYNLLLRIGVKLWRH